MTTTVSAREFNQNASAALRLAAEEPVFITKRGTPTNVILSIEDYQRWPNRNLGVPSGCAFHHVGRGRARLILILTANRASQILTAR